MAKVKTPRRGGRKKNEWTLVTLEQLLGYIAAKELKQKSFAAHLGVTNSTFHNWKNGRCAPDELIQGKIRALIDGKEKIDMAKTTKVSRATRGTGSTTLAALIGGAKAPKKIAKKKAEKAEEAEAPETAASAGKKAAKKKVAKVAKVAKKRGRVTRTPKAVTNGNGASLALKDWNELEALGQFVRANEARSATEIGELIGTLQTVAKIFG